MKALIRDRYGPPDVLEVRDVERPVPEQGEVLVRVHAASLNDCDWGLLHGPSLPINGGGGGVGTIGVQLAKVQDLEVTGVARASKHDLMRSVGFDHVIDYEMEDFTKDGRSYDLILDTKTTKGKIVFRIEAMPSIDFPR